MSSPYRPEAVQALAAPGDTRPRTSLVTPRRALVAIAVIVMLVAGLLYAAVSSLATPAAGLGWSDGGGFVRVSAPVSGVVLTEGLVTGGPVTAGQRLGSITAADGSVAVLTAPQDGVVMQFGQGDGSWTVNAGDVIVSLALKVHEPELSLILPGIAVTGLSTGNVVAGATVWAKPLDGQAFQCTIDKVTPYEQQGAAVVAYIPSPTVARFVQENGSVAWATATCPPGALTDKLPGKVFPVSVEVERRSLLSLVFGGA